MALLSTGPVRALDHAYDHSSHINHVALVDSPVTEVPQELIDGGLAKTAGIGKAVLQTTDRNCADIGSLKREAINWPKL